MKISINWCEYFFDDHEDREKLPRTIQGCHDTFTARGLEVENSDLYARAGNVFAGRVMSCAAHPKNEKLKICRVNVGGEEELSIVCGAPNVKEGALVAVGAKKFTTTIEGEEIEDKDIQGVLSQGVIFSEKELNIGDEAGGIIIFDEGERIKAGDRLGDYLSLIDHLYELGITPNRGDCLSHLGVAREIAAAENLTLKAPQARNNSDNDEQWQAAIDDNARAACPYYGCLVVRDVDCSKPSPLWMRTLIERCGGRSVSAVVDVTNYLMLAYGQPLHAFDLDKLHGGIRVGYAKAGGALPVLDGSTVRYTPDTLLINDANGAVALAGVMGGMDSGVTESTRNILLEAAHFAPSAVRGKARLFGLNSEAAFRFERGVDATLSPVALTHAADIIKKIGGGKIGKPSFAGAPPTFAPVSPVSPQNVRAALGLDISDDEQQRLLNSLQLTTTKNDDGTFSVAVPPWRFDMTQEADIVEEVARAYGYERLQETMPCGTRLFSPEDKAAGSVERQASVRARQFFTACGFYEVMTYSFVPEKWEQALSSIGDGDRFYLQNPMSEEMAVMRSTLWGGLLDRARFNARHRQERIRLFEIGRCYASHFSKSSDKAFENAQPLLLGGVALGAAMPSHWRGDKRLLDFYDIKGLLEELCGFQNDKFSFVPSSQQDGTILHPGKAADILWGESIIGQVGELHPANAFAGEFKTPPLLFSVDLLEFMGDGGLEARNRQITTVSRFPPVSRDVVVLADKKIAGGDLLACARRAATTPIVGVQLFDFYAGVGDNNASDKHSYGFRLLLQGEGDNLTADDINQAVDVVIQALRNDYAAVLRDH